MLCVAQREVRDRRKLRLGNSDVRFIAILRHAKFHNSFGKCLAIPIPRYQTCVLVIHGDLIIGTEMKTMNVSEDTVVLKYI